MPRLIGDGLVPSSVQRRRRKLRRRLREAREPLRRKRSDAVPGPDVIGNIESQFRKTRDRVVTSDGVISKLKSRGDNDNTGSSSSSSSSSSNGGQDGEHNRGSDADNKVTT